MAPGSPGLQVVAGILRDLDGRVLIAERLGDRPFAGRWEFPGGKIQRGESPEAALFRELREEIGVEVRCCEHLLNQGHQYPDRHVSIDFFVVSDWQNDPAGLEGQSLRWCLPADIAADQLLPADEPVLSLLQAS